MGINTLARGRTDTSAQATPVGHGARWYTRAPLHFIVILIGALWLMPTIALLFTSVRNVQNIVSSGWWTLLWKPHEVTLENYRSVLESAGSIGMGGNGGYSTGGSTPPSPGTTTPPPSGTPQPSGTPPPGGTTPIIPPTEPSPEPTVPPPSGGGGCVDDRLMDDGSGGRCQEMAL